MLERACPCGSGSAYWRLEDRVSGSSDPRKDLARRIRNVRSPRWSASAAGLALVVLMSACGGKAPAPQAPSTTGGAAPAGAVTLAGGAVSSPDIAVDGRGGIHVAWVVGLTDEAKILHRYLAPGGGQWSEPRELTTGFQYNGAPRLLTDPNGDVCVFW